MNHRQNQPTSCLATSLSAPSAENKQEKPPAVREHACHGLCNWHGQVFPSRPEPVTTAGWADRSPDTPVPRTGRRGDGDGDRDETLVMGKQSDHTGREWQTTESLQHTATARKPRTSKTMTKLECRFTTLPSVLTTQKPSREKEANQMDKKRTSISASPLTKT